MKRYDVIINKERYTFDDLQHKMEDSNVNDKALQALEAALYYYSYDILELDDEEAFYDYYDTNGELYYLDEAAFKIIVYIRDGGRKGRILHKLTATIIEDK